MDSPNYRQSGCPKDQYPQPKKGCTLCATICFPGADLGECDFYKDYCCEYWRDFQKEESKQIQNYSNYSNRSDAPITNIFDYSHKDRGDSVNIGVPVGVGLLLVLAACICGCVLWRWYQKKQNEKKKGHQETGYVEEGTMPPGELRKEIDDVTNARHEQPCQNDPDTQPMPPVISFTSETPPSAQEATPQPPADCSSPANASPTTYPKHVDGENVVLTPNNAEDNDHTSVKVIADSKTSENPSPESSTSPPLETNTERRNSNDLTRPSHSNISTQTSQSDPSLPVLHRVGLRRGQGPPFLITIPTASNEPATAQAEASFIHGQASPDPVVTEPLVTEATIDATSKSSITRNKNYVHLYRLDVNQVGHEEASAIQAVDNIPQEFGIEVRNNPEEYLQ